MKKALAILLTLLLVLPLYTKPASAATAPITFTIKPVDGVSYDNNTGVIAAEGTFKNNTNKNVSLDRVQLDLRMQHASLHTWLNYRIVVDKKVNPSDSLFSKVIGPGKTLSWKFYQQFNIPYPVSSYQVTTTPTYHNIYSPSVNTVTDHSTVITGKADSNAKVYALVGSKNIGVTTTKNGQFKMKIGKQKAGTTITIYAIDHLGNKSLSKTIKVIDKTPPATPTVKKVTSKTKIVTGKGEKGATIYIYKGSKKIGQGIVDSKGNYKVKIKAQKKRYSLKVYAKDKSGNTGKSKTIKVS